LLADLEKDVRRDAGNEQAYCDRSGALGKGNARTSCVVRLRMVLWF
jgi:hypothetical protein